MAIFARNDLIKKPLVTDLNSHNLPLSNVKYKEIYTVDCPYYKDERTQDEKIWCEAQYFINQHRNAMKYFNEERRIYQLPWIGLMDLVRRQNASQEELLNILREHDTEIEGDFIILPEYDDDDGNGLSNNLDDLSLDLHNDHSENSYQVSDEFDGSLIFNGKNGNNDAEEYWD
uniref:Uncharacterized protein n=1 Tax=Glossina brevipalpis TaxID=37001 RepID=A0A1A9WMQ0_9MUSC